MRVVILDTETTGLDPSKDRIVEIGCVELIDLRRRGQWHTYINPQMKVSDDAVRVHGLDNAFLARQPLFQEKVDEMLAFIGDSPIAAHNAGFDVGFLAAELRRLGRPPLPNQVIDTLALAKRKFPGGKHTLDALCRRFRIDLSRRTLHGALLDAQLLADVYVELEGGRQFGFDLVVEKTRPQAERRYRPPRPHAPTPEVLAAHAEFLKKLTDPIWLQDEPEQQADEGPALVA